MKMFKKCKNSNGYTCNLCDGKVMVVGKEFMKEHRKEHKKETKHLNTTTTTK